MEANNTTHKGRRRRSFTEEFKRAAVNLVVVQGYSFKAAAGAVGVGSRSLREWHDKFGLRPKRSREGALLQQLQVENRRLRRALKRAEVEREILKKSHGVSREGVAMKHAWIEEHLNSRQVLAMCRTLQVSKSGFYRSRSAKSSARALRSVRIREAVKQVHEQSNGIYGSYKITQRLQADEALETASRNTVAAAMSELGLKSKVSQRFKPTTTIVDPTRKSADNLLDQIFQADQPNRKWVADITYLPTQSGWVYLAAMLDLFSRKIVGWSISDSLATAFVSDTLYDAIDLREPDPKLLLHHSDRGCQYTSEDYQKTLKTLGIT